MSSPDRIDDLVVLGRAAPEPIADGRHTVCLGGYSETHGYVRLYPTQTDMTNLSRWNIVSVPVEDAAPEDTRDESYKIAGSREDWDILPEKIEKTGELSKSEQIRLTEKLSGDCPTALNENRTSLGIVKPQSIRDFYIKPDEDPTYQTTIFGDRKLGKKEFPYKLYIEYECEGCTAVDGHTQHCIEWGVYEYFRKNDDPEGVIGALGLDDEKRDHYFFVGNLNHRRNAYIIISDLRFTHSDMRDAGMRTDSQFALTDF